MTESDSDSNHHKNDEDWVPGCKSTIRKENVPVSELQPCSAHIVREFRIVDLKVSILRNGLEDLHPACRRMHATITLTAGHQIHTVKEYSNHIFNIELE